MGLLSAYDELQKNQSGTVKGELVTVTAFLSAFKDALNPRDWGAGEQKKAYAVVTAAAALNPGTSAQFQVGVADDLVGTNFTVLADSGAIATAKLTAGAFVQIGILKSGTSKRYLCAKVTVAGGNATTGAVIVGITDKNDGQQTYGDLTNSL